MDSFQVVMMDAGLLRSTTAEGVMSVMRNG
jgi:hypothetical protein